MGSFCTVCRQRIPSGSRCRRHRVISPSSRAWHAPGANRVRARVLARDDHRCVRCGSDRELQVHHLVGAGAGGDNSPENLEVLCGECHRKEHESQ